MVENPRLRHDTRVILNPEGRQSHAIHPFSHRIWIRCSTSEDLYKIVSSHSFSYAVLDLCLYSLHECINYNVRFQWEMHRKSFSLYRVIKYCSSQLLKLLKWRDNFKHMLSDAEAVERLIRVTQVIKVGLCKTTQPFCAWPSQNFRTFANFATESSFLM